MNKIKVVNDKISSVNVDDSIVYKHNKAKEIFEISTLSISNNTETELFLDIDISENIKLDISFQVNKNSNIFIYCHGTEGKIRYNYKIDNGSKCHVTKYNDVNIINEMVIVDLNKEQSEIFYTLKSIGTKKENYDYVVNHNSSKSISNIYNHCVNKNGSINIQISAYVPKNTIGCTCNQNNRIINLALKKCEIRPNLYIDCDDVDANHSALVGKFSDDEMFYLNSRGISETDANNLLIKGFLLNMIDNDQIKRIIEKNIDKYWR